MKLTFEWDEAKNLANTRKHKISFEEVTHLFNEDNIQFRSDRNKEERMTLVAKYTSPLHKPIIFISVIYTIRPPNIRIISARRSKKQEIQAYIQKFNQS